MSVEDCGNTGERVFGVMLGFGDNSGGGAGRLLSLSTSEVGESFSRSCLAFRSARSFARLLRSS
jgi:hypothetical protein